MESSPSEKRAHLSSSSSSSSSSASKLPIKRKSPHLHLLSPRTASAPFHPDAVPITTLNPRSPFKFHRIWTEPDEILFLHALFDSSSHGLSFPRDMPIFYHKFSSSLSQPYTKSQFSEKLRRLRRKFRVISARISRGLCYSRLSPHDRALFDVSKKLWGSDLDTLLPDVQMDSRKIDLNAGGNTNISVDYSQRINMVGVKVTFAPVLPVKVPDRGEVDCRLIDINKAVDGNVGEMRVDCDLGGVTKGGLEGAESVVAKSVMSVFDESMKEVERIREREKLRALSESEFERRWKVQRIAEVDVFARRLRLVLENSVNKLSF
ncbi:DNA-binding storekeeper protein-related transcriptional regulator [Euphorbia peplus]|nr:DNA-binding storekeeper protein-related transcriptional regulator [Euphorbia peplus]